MDLILKGKWFNGKMIKTIMDKNVYYLGEDCGGVVFGDEKIVVKMANGSRLRYPYTEFMLEVLKEKYGLKRTSFNEYNNFFKQLQKIQKETELNSVGK